MIASENDVRTDDLCFYTVADVSFSRKHLPDTQKRPLSQSTILVHNACFTRVHHMLLLDPNLIPQAPPSLKVNIVWGRYAQRAWEKDDVGKGRNKSNLQCLNRTCYDTLLQCLRHLCICNVICSNLAIFVSSHREQGMVSFSILSRSMPVWKRDSRQSNPSRLLANTHGQKARDESHIGVFKTLTALFTYICKSHNLPLRTSCCHYK